MTTTRYCALKETSDGVLLNSWSSCRPAPNSELQNLLNNADTHEEVAAARSALARLHQLRLQDILADFNKASATFVEYTSLLQSVIDQIEVELPATPAPRTFNDLLSAGSTVFAAIRAPERLASATAPDDVTIMLPVTDEAEAPPSAMPRAAPPPAGAVRLPPVNSTAPFRTSPTSTSPISRRRRRVRKTPAISASTSLG